MAELCWKVSRPISWILDWATKIVLAGAGMGMCYGCGYTLNHSWSLHLCNLTSDLLSFQWPLLIPKKEGGADLKMLLTLGDFYHSWSPWSFSAALRGNVKTKISAQLLWESERLRLLGISKYPFRRWDPDMHRPFGIWPHMSSNIKKSDFLLVVIFKGKVLSTVLW